jgi:hypothetical protein
MLTGSTSAGVGAAGVWAAASAGTRRADEIVIRKERVRIMAGSVPHRVRKTYGSGRVSRARPQNVRTKGA